jgi:hypothetical protein
VLGTDRQWGTLDRYEEVFHDRAHCSVRASCFRVTTRSIANQLLCRFLVVSHFTDYDKTHLFINGVILAVLLVAKFPEMHGVRLFRINKATVDDAEATE